MKNIIIILITIVVIILVYATTCKKETYAPTVIPFDYESPVKQMQLDKFYEHVINYINDFDQYGNPRPRRFEAYTDCRALQSDRKDLILNERVYYDKFRESQDKVTELTNILVRTQDDLDAYKKSLIFCRRQLTLKPIVAKYVWPTSVDPYFRVTGNTLTGTGVETQFKQGNTENA